MRRASIILVVLPFLTGCNLWKYFSYNTANESINVLEDKSINHRAEKLAADAWLDHLAHLPDSCPPDAYKEGFQDGYKDHLIHGGNAAPPTVPPVRYRRKKNLNPEGQLEVRAYFGGFAAGSTVAKASGLRAFFVIPISTPLPKEEQTGYDTVAVGSKKQTADRPLEELPAPRQVPNSDAKELQKPQRLPDPLPKQLRNRPGNAPAREPVVLEIKQPLPDNPSVAPVRQPKALPVKPQPQFRPAVVEAQPPPQPQFRPAIVEAQPPPQPQFRPAVVEAQPPPQPQFRPAIVEAQPPPQPQFRPAVVEAQPPPQPQFRPAVVEAQPPPQSQFRPAVVEPRQPLPSPFLPTGAGELPRQSEFRSLPPLAPIMAPSLEPPASTEPAPPSTGLPREFNVQIQGGPASR